jgi:hypothetical protein
MKRNIIITASVVFISIILIGASAYYKFSTQIDHPANELDPSMAASIVTNEVSGTISSDDSDSTDSTLTSVPEGVYTNGSESMIFTADTVNISGMIFNYTLDDGYVKLDVDNLTFSDEFVDLYKSQNPDDADIDAQLEKTKESASDIVIQYNEQFDWVTYEEYIFKRTEDYTTGPSGTYQDEENPDVTLSFDNGTATYVNGDTTESYPYVIYLDGEQTLVTFYTLDLYSGIFYNSYCENNYFYYSDAASIDLGFGTFVKTK